MQATTPQRPEIICHMISSLDGRLLPDRWQGLPEAAIDLYEEVAEKYKADGWIVGRKTMEAYLPTGPAALAPQPAASSATLTSYIGQRGNRPLCVCFDRTGVLRPQSDEVDGSHLVLVLSTGVSQDHVTALAAKGITVLFAGADGDDIAAALQSLAYAFGKQCLLLEGGGILNGAFLAKGLIDETSTLIVPYLDGQSGIPTIYDHQKETQGQLVELVGVERLDHGVVWLRHHVKHR
ncbi:riboflavin deaminase [Cohaesibacter sp. CAU 1516]|uniref:dihydrofolate reductase family protein n=1 Tax=Cohaesibacter sp. CAU 1516 TaxID=2576038 RepID=UPI0010FF3F5A|nr:dihydrofolate reductase family protein [Cohaesibacter sp. CAU 1516]TLP44219.1 riboflavin deaminase [Cohaesibacter sp. CAU 1516]